MAPKPQNNCGNLQVSLGGLGKIRNVFLDCFLLYLWLGLFKMESTVLVTLRAVATRTIMTWNLAGKKPNSLFSIPKKRKKSQWLNSLIIPFFHLIHIETGFYFMNSVEKIK